MPGEDRDRVADLEARRLPSHALASRYAVRCGYWRYPLARGAAQPLHLFLLPGISRGYGIHARIVSPGGHHIGFHRERLGEFVALRQYRRLATLFGRGSHACVVGVEQGPGGGIGASVRRRARASSLSRNRFDGARLKYQRSPSVSRCSIRPSWSQRANSRRSDQESAAHVRSRGLVEGKNQADAAHALALEGPLGGIACRCQQRFGIAEATAVGRSPASGAPLLAAMPIRRVRGRHPGNNGTQAGGGGQTRFANGRIHSDTSGAVVMAV